MVKSFNNYCFYDQDNQVPPDAFKKAHLSMADFDNNTRAKAWGFSSSNHLYRQISSGPFLSYINIPLFVIHAKDDIICREEDIPKEELLANKNCMYLETQYGGHCNFFDSSSDIPKAKLYPNIITKYLEDVIEFDKVNKKY